MSKSTQEKKQNKFREMLALRMKYHPVRVFVYLMLVGSSSAFVFLSIAYFLATYGTTFNHFRLPLIFHANTLIMLVSSYTIAQTRKAIMEDNWDGYLNGLVVTGALAIGFTIFQIEGWQELKAEGIMMQNNIAGAYLYFISGLHLIHLLIGIILIASFVLKAAGIKKDPVKMLIYESNPFHKMQVGILTTYWHFVDGLWLYLYLFFLLNIYVFAR